MLTVSMLSTSYLSYASELKTPITTIIILNQIGSHQKCNIAPLFFHDKITDHPPSNHPVSISVSTSTRAPMRAMTHQSALGRRFWRRDLSAPFTKPPASPSPHRQRRPPTKSPRCTHPPATTPLLYPPSDPGLLRPLRPRRVAARRTHRHACTQTRCRRNGGRGAS